HAPLVGFPAGDELRIEPDAGVVEEAVAVDVADVDAPDGARLCHFGRRLEVGDPERPGEVVAGAAGDRQQRPAAARRVPSPPATATKSGRAEPFSRTAATRSGISSPGHSTIRWPGKCSRSSSDDSSEPAVGLTKTMPGTAPRYRC